MYQKIFQFVYFNSMFFFFPVCCGIVAYIGVLLYLEFVIDKLAKCHWKETQIRSFIIC